MIPILGKESNEGDQTRPLSWWLHVKKWGGGMHLIYGRPNQEEVHLVNEWSCLKINIWYVPAGKENQKK